MSWHSYFAGFACIVIGFSLLTLVGFLLIHFKVKLPSDMGGFIAGCVTGCALVITVGAILVNKFLR